MDENFLLHKRRAMELLGFHEGWPETLVAVRFLVRHAINQYTMRELVELGVSWVWIGPRIAPLPVLQTAWNGHAQAGRPAPAARHQAAGIHHRGPRAPHPREHSERARARSVAQHRLSTSSCSTRPCRHASVRRDGRAGAHAARHRPWPIFTARTASTSSTRLFRATIPSTGWIGPFAAISRINGPSIYRICRTTLEGWMRYKTTPIRACGARFQWEARALKDGYAAAAVGYGEASPAHQRGRSANGFARCAKTWAGEFGLSAAW